MIAWVFWIPFWFPAGNTFTLNYGGTYTQSQYAQAGSTVSFSASTGSPSTPISVIISDIPLTSFPLTNVTGTITDGFTEAPNDYNYEWLYLNAGSTFNYTFTCSLPEDFLILDATNFNNWLNNQAYTAYVENASIASATAQVVHGWSSGVPYSQDYYLVWYDTSSSNSITVSVSIGYTRMNVRDFSGALYYQENETSVSQTTVTLPSTGTWYFIAYMDPWNSPDASTTLTYSVTFYAPGYKPVTPAWEYILPIVIAVIFVVACVAILTSRARTRRRFASAPPGTFTAEPGPMPSQPTAGPAQAAVGAGTVVNPPGVGNCPYCGAQLSPGAQYCLNCGRRQESAPVAQAGTRSPRTSKYCSFCGAELEPGAKFCQSCGNTVE